MPAEVPGMFNLALPIVVGLVAAIMLISAIFGVLTSLSVRLRGQ